MLTALPLVLAAAAAQQATTPNPDPQKATVSAPATQGGDIVVTARRREETAQKVPIALSVVSAQTIQQTGAYNVNRLQQLLPSLTFYSTNPRNSAANIRGLGAPFGLTNDGIEQGVGLYVDGVYYSRIAAATFDFLDVDRIEVLRGPQGTLYGKNTTAGAINITTRQPSFDFEGRAEISAGNYDFIQAKAAVSGPLVDDKLAIRLAISSTHRRGTIWDTTTKDWLQEQDNLGIRGQLLWRATNRLNVTLSGDWNHQDPNCCAQIYVRTGSTQRALNRQYAALAAAFGYAPPSTNPFDRVTDLDSDVSSKQSFGGASLRGDLNLGASTFTSITAWRFWDWNPSSDRDFTGLPITTISANPSKQNQYTQEFRLASNGTRTLDYTVGAFFYYQTINTGGIQQQGSAASRWLLSPPAGGCTPTSTADACNPAVLDGLTSANDISLKNTSAALFGDITWHVAPGVRIEPGLRLNYDKKVAHYAALVTTGTGAVLSCIPAPTAAVAKDQCATLPPQTYKADFDGWNVSGNITVSADLAPTISTYLTYARSFKSGGVNLSGLPLDANNNPILAAATVRPETVNHYEVGFKSKLLNHAVTLNLGAFWTDIFNYQATVTNGQLGVLRGYLANAGLVRVRGFEGDFNARVSPNLNLYANAAFTDAKYVRFRDAPCPPELSGGTTADATHPASAPGTPGGYSPAACDISGQWLPGVSRFSSSFGAEYSLPAKLLGLSGRAYLGGDGSYRSKFSSNPSRSAYTDIAGYALANFRLGYRSDDGWNGFLWVRNAFNADYFEVLATQSGNTGLVVGQPGDPRTYGLTLARTF